MRYGFIGLGNLGGKLAASLARNGFDLVVHDADPKSAEPLLAAGRPMGGDPRGGRGASRRRHHLPALPRRLRARADRPRGRARGREAGRDLDRDEHHRSGYDPAPRRRRRGERRRNPGERRSPAACISPRRAKSPSSSAATPSSSSAIARPSPRWAGGFFTSGPIGSASLIKVITNMLAFVHLVAAGEALMLAKRGGLDLAQAFHVISASSGTSFVHETESQLILNGSYNINFTMDLACKDLGFAMKFGRDFGVPLDLAALTTQTFIRAREAYGGGAWSTQVVKLLEDALGTDLRAPGFPAEL